MKDLKHNEMIKDYFLSNILNINHIDDIPYLKLRNVLPYVIRKIDNNRFILLNRDYCPIFTYSKEYYKFQKFSFELSNLDIKNDMYFFDDDSHPFDSINDLKKYFNKLFSIIIENNDDIIIRNLIPFMEYIENFKIKSINTNVSSYNLKHIAENFIYKNNSNNHTYIPVEIIEQLMIEYNFKQVSKNDTSYKFYNISNKVLNFY